MVSVKVQPMNRRNNRKQFLATVAATGAALALQRSRRASAQPTSAAKPAPPTPAAPGSPGLPSAAPTEKPPSAAALAVAAAMRRFDPKLSDAEVLEIAKSIDDDAQAGAALNPKKKRLGNSDQPVTVFTVPQR
jgi:hypothetical protein